MIEERRTTISIPPFVGIRNGALEKLGICFSRAGFLLGTPIARPDGCNLSDIENDAALTGCFIAWLLAGM